MNIDGYEEIERILEGSGVEATMAPPIPIEGEHLRYVQIDFEIEASSDQPITQVGYVLNVLNAAMLIHRNSWKREDFHTSPVLEYKGYTDYSVLFEDLNIPDDPIES